MNPVEKALRQADAAQQHHTPTAFLFGVIKKFGDDNGGALVSNLAYTGFVTVFPLLLILVTVLVNIAARDPSLRGQVIHAATMQFPLIGRQLASNIHGLKRATTASLVVGLLLLVWGVTKLAQAGLFAMEQVWNLPGPSRAAYFPRLGRSVVFLAILALGVITSTLLASLITYGQHAFVVRVLAQCLAALANIGLYYLGFRALTPRAVRSRQLVPGAAAGGLFWTVLQAFGAYLVHHDLRSDSVYGIFASVLGLVAWIYVAAEAAIYAAEINVVLAHKLWPRAMVQPPLTEADRAAMARQALQNQRRPEQQVEVTFSDRPEGPNIPARTSVRPEEAPPPVTGKPAPEPRSQSPG